MGYDYRKLLGRITEKCAKQYVFAEKMKWSEHTCSKKLRGDIEFKQSEIVKACAILEIPNVEIPTYFFNLEVL
jgi:hypothetical protein